ncbi:hypothetical protein F0562_031477 [Nyssa sinensis]|uniref:Uncharacterized protein n=1 Tax=Nyssa sinensis TaxID=561372 RepID=A0A5J5AU12_9ASTE|nr:hypothetical protein F0562_031477 [Nyssa sinensis]
MIAMTQIRKLPAMGRRKQVRPHRSVGILNSRGTAEGELNDQNPSETMQKDESFDMDKPFFVEVERSSWVLDEHFDISEVLLTNLNLGGEFSGYRLNEGFLQDSKYSLRFRLCNVNEFTWSYEVGTLARVIC